MDNINKELFKIQQKKIQDDDKDLPIERDFDSIVTFPLNIGLTGVCIAENKSIYFNEGTRMG